MRGTAKYSVKKGHLGTKPYIMAYKHFFPAQPTESAVVVFIHGGGHDSLVWTETPDGRAGLAPLFAAHGREVITLDWACSAAHPCSRAAFCRLTQNENMALITRVIARELAAKRKVIFFGWSMGGPQAFKLAADILPRRTAAVLGYAATGPLNFYHPKKVVPTDLNRPYIIPEYYLDRFWNTRRLEQRWKTKYKKRYVMPVPPRMVAIQSKDPQVKNEWLVLTIRQPRRLPPMLLLNGSLDAGHAPQKEKIFAAWLKRYQRDVTFEFLPGHSHLGMLAKGNDKIARLYLNWLSKRKI